jgi:hypothetical protein
MQAQDFAKFVESQQDTAQGSGNGAPEDWGAIRDQWLRDLDALHTQIGDFLSEFVTDGKIHYSFTDVTLSEENIGSYIARRMDIKIGRQEVFLEPVGTLFLGCRGRVDAVGSGGRALLVLVDEKAESAANIRLNVNVAAHGGAPSAAPFEQPVSWAWKIVTHDVRRTFAKLDRDSFFELLMDIAGA